MEQKNKRMAVLVGCNYPNTRYELHGCINDVTDMRQVLLDRFGFDPVNVEMLTDDGSESEVVMPTGANIKAALGRMVDKAETGDVLFFHYSGHGTRIPSVKPGHPFRKDEAIVPCDFNLITDVDFRELVNRIPEGASFTMISDSCHSGGLIDNEKEQIGPSVTTRGFTNTSETRKPKSIPFESVMEHLASQTNIATSDVGTHLLELFGGDAGLNFRMRSVDLSDFLGLKKPTGDSGILLSGCQADETSADMNPTMADADGGGRGKAYGAFSNAVQTVLKEHLGSVSNKELVVMAREVLRAGGVLQHPCLYCSDDNAQAAFLLQQSNGAV